MACMNNCRCCSMVSTTSVSVVDGALVLVIPNNNYVNHQMVCIGVSQSAPSQSPPIPVKVGLGSTADVVDVITENGNYLYSDQLYRNRILRVQVATDSSLLVKRGCYNRTSAVFPEPLSVENTESEVTTNG